MCGIELIEPGVELRHPRLAVELLGDSALGERRDVQPGAPRLVIKVVRKADVPTGHTHRLHTQTRAESP